MGKEAKKLFLKPCMYYLFSATHRTLSYKLFAHPEGGSLFHPSTFQNTASEWTQCRVPAIEMSKPLPSYCEVKEKTTQFHFQIFSKVIKISLRYLWWSQKKHIRFFRKYFRGRNFEARRNFDEKPTNVSFQNGRKSLPDTKKSDFSAVSQSIRLISWKSG